MLPAVPVPVVPSAKLLSTVRPCPVLGGGGGGGANRVKSLPEEDAQTFAPTHTNSVRATHLPDPPCSLLANLVPGVSGSPRALPDSQSKDLSRCPIHKNGVFPARGVSKVDSAKLGHERDLGGKRVAISPQLMFQRLATAPGIQST